MVQAKDLPGFPLGKHSGVLTLPKAYNKRKIYMKTKDLKIKSSNTSSLLRKTFERAKMISVKNTKMFLTFLNKMSWRVVILATFSSLKGARNRVKMIHNFGRYLVNCNRKHGPD
jgi:hypothetical protein